MQNNPQTEAPVPDILTQVIAKVQQPSHAEMIAKAATLPEILVPRP